MSMIFSGEDDQLAVDVAVGYPDRLIALGFLKGRRHRLEVRYTADRARQLACAILRACDHVDGVEWTLEAFRTDGLERLLVTRQRAAGKARRAQRRRK